MSGEYLKLAEWNQLSYYLVEEKSFSCHVVLVRDEEGRKDRFILESGLKLEGNLPLQKSNQAREIIKEFSSEFIDYIHSFKSSRCV